MASYRFHIEVVVDDCGEPTPLRAGEIEWVAGKLNEHARSFGRWRRDRPVIATSAKTTYVEGNDA